jgi:hypothetical protein
MFAVDPVAAHERTNLEYVTKILGGACDVCDHPEIAEAVRRFNDRYGEMERALWCLSVNSRADLLAGNSSPVLENLVWTVKKFWSVRGVKRETKIYMARALVELTMWSPDIFEPQTDYSPRAAIDACKWVDELVNRIMSLGVARLLRSRTHAISRRHTERSRWAYSRGRPA